MSSFKILGNPLLRLLVVNWLIGLAATVLVVGGLLLTDAAGLRSLIVRSDAAVPAIALLFFGFLITLTSAAMGTAIMGLPREASGSGGHGARRGSRVRPIRVPLPVQTGARPRH